MCYSGNELYYFVIRVKILSTDVDKRKTSCSLKQWDIFMTNVFKVLMFQYELFDHNLLLRFSAYISCYVIMNNNDYHYFFKDREECNIVNNMKTHSQKYEETLTISASASK